ncbi:MAG: hypothetical protein ACLGGV_06630 [Bacteroidia bacterium]
MKTTKTKITTVVFSASALFLSINFSFAQNNWKTTGNGFAFPNAVNATSFLGTTNSVPLQLRTTLDQPILFQTTNLERMRISPDGLVGINIATPEATLDVNGTIKITALACDNCLVTTDEKGNLSTQENTIALLEQRIKQLEEQLTKLQEQLLTMK